MDVMKTSRKYYRTNSYGIIMTHSGNEMIKHFKSYNRSIKAIEKTVGHVEDSGKGGWTIFGKLIGGNFFITQKPPN